MDVLLAAGLPIAAAAGVYGVSAIGEVRGLHDWLVPGAIWRVSAPHVVLTFDDGPDQRQTPRLLDVLARAKARAVFFVVGEQARKNPDLLRRMAGEGHQIGNHSFSHPWMVSMARRRIAIEIDRCQEIVADVTGRAPVLARPPFGMRDYRYYQVVRARGLTPVLWSRNLRDYWGGAPAVVARRLARSRPGDVLLLHDGDPKATWTVEAVEMWLKTAPAVGLI